MEKSLVVKRSVVVGGHKTSVSLEEAFWNSLHEIAEERDMTRSALVAEIDTARRFANLSSAIRVFVLGAYQEQVSATAAAGSIGNPDRRSMSGPAH
jgi:predicted DNA-binding ribbon-helix-helix protein